MLKRSNILKLGVLFLALLVGQSFGAAGFTSWWNQTLFKNNQKAINAHALKLLTEIEQEIRIPNKNITNQHDICYPHFDQLKPEHKKLVLQFFGLPTNAPLEKIKPQYLKLCKNCHPDRGGDPESFKKLKLLFDDIHNLTNTYHKSARDLFKEEIMRQAGENRRKEAEKREREKREQKAREEREWQQSQAYNREQWANEHLRNMQRERAAKQAREDMERNKKFNNFQQEWTDGPQFQFQQEQDPEPQQLLLVTASVAILTGIILYNIWPSSLRSKNLALLMDMFAAEQELQYVSESRIVSGPPVSIKQWDTNISYRPLINFNANELAIVKKELSGVNRSTWEPLCTRYIQASRGIGKYSQSGFAPHLGGFGTVYTLDLIQNGCNLISSNLFDTVHRIINDEFVPKILAKGAELHLPNDKYLFHKLGAATIVAETARTFFNIETLKPKRKACMTAKQIRAEEEAHYQIRTIHSASDYDDERATQKRFAALEQQLLAEFRTALTQKLAPFMAAA